MPSAAKLGFSQVLFRLMYSQDVSRNNAKKSTRDLCIMHSIRDLGKTAMKCCIPKASKVQICL